LSCDLELRELRKEVAVRKSVTSYQDMEAMRGRSQEMVVRGVLCIMLTCSFHGLLLAADLPNCSFPAVYTFGDSLSDNGNANAAFPEQFMDAANWPNGVLAPRYPAGRYCDGWLLTDYIGENVDINFVVMQTDEGNFAALSLRCGFC